MKYIPVAQPFIGQKEKQYVNICMKTAWISSAGTFIEKFEKAFARKFHVRYAITTSNGTTALHLALLALGITSGDEVIVPALTFVASANAVRFTGAKPVFVDVDQNTWNIDPQKIEEKITPRTRAIMPVHLYGYPADMDAIRTIAKKHKLFIIEDAAEAHGARYNKQYVGTIGDIGVFSFYGNKIITTGEGGMIVTNNRKFANAITMLKNHGMSPHKKYYHPILGYNYRMTNVQAAIGLGQLEQLDIFLTKRAHIEKQYRKLLARIPALQFQPQYPNIKPVCWLFSCRITAKSKLSRNAVIDYLQKKYIDSRPFFYPLPKLPMYQTKELFPVAQKLSNTGINLPTFVTLTKRDISYVCSIIIDRLS